MPVNTCIYLHTFNCQRSVKTISKKFPKQHYLMYLKKQNLDKIPSLDSFCVFHGPIDQVTSKFILSLPVGLNLNMCGKFQSL